MTISKKLAYFIGDTILSALVAAWFAFIATLFGADGAIVFAGVFTVVLWFIH
jgi:hypothetical protein